MTVKLRKKETGTKISFLNEPELYIEHIFMWFIHTQESLFCNGKKHFWTFTLWVMSRKEDMNQSGTQIQDLNSFKELITRLAIPHLLSLSWRHTLPGKYSEQ